MKIDLCTKYFSFVFSDFLFNKKTKRLNNLGFGIFLGGVDGLWPLGLSPPGGSGGAGAPPVIVKALSLLLVGGRCLHVLFSSAVRVRLVVRGILWPLGLSPPGGSGGGSPPSNSKNFDFYASMACRDLHCLHILATYIKRYQLEN